MISPMCQHKVKTEVWILPRPHPSKYPGGFPLHFEKKLLRYLGIDPAKHKILHPFGGMADYGIRCDLRETHPLTDKFGDAVSWRKPDVICDAHNLPFSDNEFDLIICDPPYSEEESKELYGTGPVVYKKYIQEAVRVCRPGGFVVSYHVVMTPRPNDTTYHSRILVGTRVWHRLRACCIFQKTIMNVLES